MSLLENRGGIPHIFRDSIDTTGRCHVFRFDSKYLQIRVASAPCKLYFKEDDFDNDENYIQVPIPSTTTPYGEFQGPIGVDRIWLKGVGGNSDVELVVYRRLN